MRFALESLRAWRRFWVRKLDTCLAKFWPWVASCQGFWSLGVSTRLWL